MEEQFDSFFKQEGPFYPVEEFRMDRWKRAVQDVINDVIADTLKFRTEERNIWLLTDIFKRKWHDLSVDWFRHETSYLLWLVHVSSLLLPLLEEETGCFKGWIQYRKYPKAWSSQHFTVPLIQDGDTYKLYIFEKNPHLLMRAMNMVTAAATHSSEQPPRSVLVYSMEDGHSNIYRMLNSDERKQD
ncbi:hypothetical protein [Bacillus piscicola]|uniref:hypothetical protein n=1 Tax=Bacillus piscicola TaxID=1632684 RepID=UPI001F08F7DF|nr:hypothetical protein [Bacillus piscicola]